VEKALEYVNKAIQHTPTVVELYLVKAKIFQFAGNQAAANKLVEEGRTLD